MPACSTARVNAGLDADHLRARAHGFAQPPVLLLEGALFERVFHRDHHAVAPQRLFEKIEGAGAGGFHRVGDRGVAGDHDDRRGDLAGLQFAQQVDAAGVGQPHVHQEQIDAGPFGKGAHLGGGADGVHLIALALQNHAQRAADILFVVNDQNAPGWHDSSATPVRARGKQHAEARAAQFAGNQQNIAARKQSALARDGKPEAHAALLE